MTKNHDKIVSLCLCGIFAALCSVGAFIKVPMPGCPFTLQCLFTTLAGLILGAKRGAISVAVYVFAGLIGLPVFTSGGGFWYVVNPNFGYLLGFILGAYITGKIVHTKAEPSYLWVFTASYIGLLAVFAVGMIYYYIISNFYLAGDGITVKALFLYCFLAVIPGDLILLVVGTLLGKRLIPLTAKYRKDVIYDTNRVAQS